eukprot:CAMPEP_0202731142 /NCGR_PEP_ID=MMETSP1385-20130828/186996_1 /ASSEMBLY_ACC=CAM_ASM_000861 /TAXON_ID=933848 /ORGANISM="Elphidium margaritaceum" /LENGTH=281 /DNA_ID=CAMNT_0049397425 /DNA_START=34 /DNA_END=879 /DNA_ORIENTATION=+
MGNKLQNAISDADQSRSDQVIIDLNRAQKTPIVSTDVNILLEERRLVFVSVIGLYNSWKQCATHLLFPAIVLLPMKRCWIYKPKKYTEEIVSTIGARGNCILNNEIKDFVAFLKWKDTQKLAFFMLDDYPADDEIKSNSLIHPFWSHLSRVLQTLHDPVQNTLYRGLQLDDVFWTTRYGQNTSTRSRYGVTPATVLSEVYCLSMRFKPMKEILRQSNPESLLPIETLSELERACAAKSTNTGSVEYRGVAGSADAYGFTAMTLGDSQSLSSEWVVAADYDD